MDDFSFVFSKITFNDIEERLGIDIKRGNFIPQLPETAIADALQKQLQSNQEDMIMLSEKAISEAIIAPVLMFVKRMNQDKISLFSGELLTDGLVSGFCDFMFVGNSQAFFPQPPVVILVEAKRHDLISALPQCIGEMYIARKINRKAEIEEERIFGCVTTGKEWKFLQLMHREVIIQDKDFLITELEKIVGIFNWMINQFKT